MKHLNIPNNLKSRKFWLAVGAFITFVAAGEYNEAMLVIMGYLGVEGAADATERYQNARYKQSPTGAMIEDEDDVVDTTKIVSGDDI